MAAIRPLRTKTLLTTLFRNEKGMADEAALTVTQKGGGGGQEQD
jgi:hypothetical protein